MSNSKTAPTLDDVARAAGVSSATVSRCLNTPERVVEKTRQRVLAAVEELGYTPNFAAQVMAAKRTLTIGAIIPTMENAIFARGLQAFQEELHKLGYTLLVASSIYRPEVEMEQIKTMVSRGADAILLIGHERQPEIYDYLERRKVPTLVAWTFREDARVPSVGFDNKGAMAQLTTEVLKQGHRKIAMISGKTDGNDRARLRVQGAQAALTAFGLDPDSLVINEAAYEIEHGADAMAELMRGLDRPSAVLCGNDVLAAGALLCAHRLKLDVPGDVSITGFDDIELARLVNPPLTTVHVPHREMGRRAATALVEMLEYDGTGKSACLPTFIKWRESLGPVPNLNS